MLFWRDDARHDQKTDALFAGQSRIDPNATGLLFALVAVLIAGTLKVWPLTATIVSIDLPLAAADAWQTTLNQWVPFDARRGEEGVSLQGSLLIAMLGLVGFSAWKGFENISEGANRWTWIALSVAAVTLLVASLHLATHGASVEIDVTGRPLAVAAALWAVAHYAKRLEAEQFQSWLWESWRFVKQIFPLLLIGVFAVGVIRPLIQPAWIEALAGQNTLIANATAVVFGVFMYFPTLVEVPVAQMFLDLGMHKGPLLAYLMADPELSLQSMLMVAAVIGRTKTAAYVALVAVFSTVAGLLYGAWVDGVSIALIGLGLIAFAALLAGALAALNGRRSRETSLKGNHA